MANHLYPTKIPTNSYEEFNEMLNDCDWVKRSWKKLHQKR